MQQIVCRLGLPPDPTGGAYSALPDLLAVFRGPTSKGSGEKGRDRRGRREEGRGWEGKGSSSFALERKKGKVGVYGNRNLFNKTMRKKHSRRQLTLPPLRSLLPLYMTTKYQLLQMNPFNLKYMYE